ncbi:MAG: succinyl-diaminopimelate desuccinylase [Gemmatimonadetes bacterium]|nr:succinyl-diaminopimelate desuccinylase [Gemmatimonadota bacterium]
MTDMANDLAHLTLDLCRIPSETGNEKRIADEVEARCRAAGGGEVHRIGNSVIHVPAPPEAGCGVELPTVALVGHLDTVRCAEDQRYEITEDRVYGCGASDMKAGVAVMLALLERRRELHTARPVWIFYDREEGPYVENGLEPVLESGMLPKLDLAFVLEPTDEALQLGCMGVLNARVTVRGRRAHSARPWQGENALYRAIPLLERLNARERRAVQRGELVFYEVTTATQVATVNSPNVVPDAVEFNLNCRFAPGRSIEDAVTELHALVAGDAEIEVRDAAPAGEVYSGHPLLTPWRERERLDVEPKQAWTDVARLTQRGIPAVNYGPGETAQAHQADEWCSIASLERNYRALRNFFTSATERALGTG